MSVFSYVSVIIPAYNVDSCLARAVLSALEQEPSPLEVIVINDGSTDKTADVARRFGGRVLYLEQTNRGPAAARNTGLAVATGKYVAFLDADDYWLPGFIKATVDFLENNPETLAVSTGWEIRPIKGTVRRFPPEVFKSDFPRQPCVLENFFDFWGRYDHVRTGTVLVRRSKLSKGDIQRTDLRICEDLEFWGYLTTLGSWGFIPEAYWYGDSAKVAAKDGWLKKYKVRRNLCPSVEMWQERIKSKLNDTEWIGFKQIRGRVAASYAQNTILAGRFRDAREIVKIYGTEMPKTWLSRLMLFGHRFGYIGWAIACCLLYLREYQKAFSMAGFSILLRVQR
jgi:glycosyltransferase involved in cell wall biosynthesis